MVRGTSTEHGACERASAQSSVLAVPGCQKETQLGGGKRRWNGVRRRRGSNSCASGETRSRVGSSDSDRDNAPGLGGVVASGGILYLEFTLLIASGTQQSLEVGLSKNEGLWTFGYLLSSYVRFNLSPVSFDILFAFFLAQPGKLSSSILQALLHVPERRPSYLQR